MTNVETMMKVEVVRSPRRRKTVSARQVGDVVRVSVPATMTRAEEEHWVTEMVRRIKRRQHAATVDLEERARGLAARFGLAAPKSARWVDNQLQRWGSCTPSDGTVRILVEAGDGAALGARLRDRARAGPSPGVRPFEGVLGHRRPVPPC